MPVSVKCTRHRPRYTSIEDSVAKMRLLSRTKTIVMKVNTKINQVFSKYSEVVKD